MTKYENDCLNKTITKYHNRNDEKWNWKTYSMILFLTFVFLVLNFMCHYTWMNCWTLLWSILLTGSFCMVQFVLWVHMSNFHFCFPHYVFVSTVTTSGIISFNRLDQFLKTQNPLQTYSNSKPKPTHFKTFDFPSSVSPLKVCPVL